MKVLSKSRFKLGLECPNKIYFSNNSEVFENQKNEDTFLQALASGGFQIEEYARLHFPEGILIDAPYASDNYAEFANKTKELLKQENVVIFEAAFLVNDLFIRTDILVKKGNKIKLIEVKAKSYDPSDQFTFLGKKKILTSSWKPYLFDLAFQTHVAKLSFPEFFFTPYLGLVNKTQKATVEGLNQLFRVSQNNEKRTGVEVLANSIDQMGDSLMSFIQLPELIEDIINDKHKYYENLGFHEAISLLRDIRLENHYPNWPAKFTNCKACEFKSISNAINKKSGFEYCFKSQFNWSESDFKRSNIFNIWDLRDTTIFERGIRFKDEISEEDIKLKENPSFISRTHRQWLQIVKERTNNFSEYVDLECLKQEIETWNFPLHFIDFETSTVPLPFHTGRKPYEQIAFQFSHHIYHIDGRIEHANEYINTTPGEFPNFIFMLNLYNALKNDEGTIFRFSTHENTILNAIHAQLKESNYEFKDLLIPFIESISAAKKEHATPWETPQRNMVDLCDIIKKYYYNPYTFGSNSIKKVLPAILKTSTFVRGKYINSIGNINLTSKNFSKNHVWLKEENGSIISPYKMLPKVFDGYSIDEIEGMLSEIENIDDGGAALTAYGKIQYTNMSQLEREELSLALLKYCELDTLAMVMIYEHLKSISS
jgi:hypothetical protein